MADPTTVDGRPIEGGSAKPVAVMNPISVTLTGTIPGTVEVANDSGNPIPVSAADGALVTLGTTTDAAIVTSTAGTVIGFLRGLISLIVAKITVIIAGAGGTPVQLDDTDKLAVSLYANAGVTAIDMLGLTSDAYNIGVYNGFIVIGRNVLSNGSTWDRQRNNHEVTALASAARTASVNSADLVNYNARGINLVFDITAVPGVETLTLTIQGKSTLSGKYYTILAGAVQVATATVVMRVYPGLIAAANLDANAVLPRIWRVSVVASAGGSFTYSVDANYVL